VGSFTPGLDLRPIAFPFFFFSFKTRNILLSCLGTTATQSGAFGARTPAAFNAARRKCPFAK